jgi:hypothetical protein
MVGRCRQPDAADRGQPPPSRSSSASWHNVDRALGRVRSIEPLRTAAVSRPEAVDDVTTRLGFRTVNVSRGRRLAARILFC